MPSFHPATLRKVSISATFNHTMIFQIQLTSMVYVWDPPFPQFNTSHKSVWNEVVCADAWNMLMGSAQEDWGTEADIDDLHNAATAAKHKIANLSKVSHFAPLNMCPHVQSQQPVFMVPESNFNLPWGFCLSIPASAVWPCLCLLTSSCQILMWSDWTPEIVINSGLPLCLVAAQYPASLFVHDDADLCVDWCHLQATNGNNTFENLIALMRESYLKYMQVAALWESIARMPNPPPNRNRARWCTR